MRSWRAVIMGACVAAAACGGAQAQQPQAMDPLLQGEVLYRTLATIGAGREVKPDGPEVQAVKKYLAFGAKRYNISEEDVGRTCSAGLNMLRQRVDSTNMFELLDAAQRIAPAEPGHDRNALVHVLTTYIGVRSLRRDSNHEDGIREATEIVAGRKKGGDLTPQVPMPVVPPAAK